MKLCFLSYRTVHTTILYADDDIDEEGVQMTLRRLAKFFKEMALLLEEMRDHSFDQTILQRLNTLLKDHLGCRAHLQAASQTFKKEGQSSKYFEDFNECGRRIGMLLAAYFTPPKEE